MAERWEELEEQWAEARASQDPERIATLRAVVAAHVEAYERLEALVAKRLASRPPVRMLGQKEPLGYALEVQDEAKTSLARFRALLARIDAGEA